MEHWVEVENYPNYIVSDEGQVVNRKTEHILRPQPTPNGYLIVSLCNENGACSKTVHRLVAKAFLDPSLCDLQVNHIDGDKTNNYLWNLELITSSDNHRHAFSIGLASLSFRFRPVRCIDTGEEFESMTDAAIKTGTHQGNISHVIQGRRKTANGFRFELID